MNTPDDALDNTPPDNEEIVRSDYDGAWKAALEKYFKEFLELLFPAIYNAVDWSKGYEFLDGELEKITVDAKTGRRYTDKLVKVYYQDGTEEWLLIHVEIQTSPELKGIFARRMFTYWSRLTDRYQVDVVSLAVLADTNQSYRPSSFKFSRSGTQMDFTYPIAKLTDYESETNWTSLEANNNVFALLVMAQIKAKRLKGNNKNLFEFRLGLTRLLYQRGYSREQVIELFHFIGWMIRFPDALEQQLIEAVKLVEEEFKMPYINTVEQYGIKQGIEKGIEKAACNLIKQTELDDKTIAAATELSIKAVAQLRQQLKDKSAELKA